jgi:putative transposase
LAKDREKRVAFNDFPAEHWKHLHTTNPIESTFGTIRHRRRRTKGSGTRKASLAMMFKLAQVAETHWKRLNGHEQLGHILERKKFVDVVLPDAA